MSQSRRFRRSRSLWLPKTSTLLDPAPRNCYDPLEGGDPIRGAGEGPGEGVPVKEEPLGAKKDQGRWARRAFSLRVRKKEEKEAVVAGEAVAHSVAPAGDDGQLLLLGDDQDGAGNRMIKCKKQVNRAVRRGWNTFMANMHSLTLSRPATASTVARPGGPR